jgi:hypothetical protein
MLNREMDSLFLVFNGICGNKYILYSYIIFYDNYYKYDIYFKIKFLYNNNFICV